MWCQQAAGAPGNQVVTTCARVGRPQSKQLQARQEWKFSLDPTALACDQHILAQDIQQVHLALWHLAVLCAAATAAAAAAAISPTLQSSDMQPWARTVAAATPDGQVLPRAV